MTIAPVEQPVVRRVSEAVARFALGGRCVEPDPAWPERPLASREFATLVGVCRAEGTIGLLSAAMSAGPLRGTDAQAAQVDTAHAALMGSVVLLEQILVAASTCLRAAGVGHRVLKGSAHAWLDWPAPCMRTFSDVDILLAGDYAAGVRTLEAAGNRRLTAEVHNGFDRRFGKGTTLVGATNHEVDVHRTLAAGAYGLLIKADELLDGGAPLLVGGCQLLALDRPQRLVHACYHASLGRACVRHATLRDVAELILRSEPPEHRRALELARSWDGLAPVAAAITAAAALLAVPPAHPLVRWATSYEPTMTDQRRLRAYAAADSSFGAQAIEGWRVLPTLSERWTYAAQLLFADPAHLLARHESTRHRWARGIRLVHRAVRR